MDAASRYHRLARLYAWVTWFGLFLNALFVFPLLLAPRFTLDLLGIELDQLIFARAAGMLLAWISAFYIPPIFDLKRYRANAWIAICPSRAGGATFFFAAVLIFGYPQGYLSIAIVDASILILQLIIMLKIRAVEQEQAGLLTPPSRKRTVLTVVGVLLVVALVAGGIGWYKLLREVDQRFDSMEEAFKYGSIGTEKAAGIPYWIWLVLPRIFPEYLPGPGGYNALGLHNEPGKAVPVGFSVKTIGFPRVGINCALCHSATIRLARDEAPMLLVAGASTTFDALNYQRFLFRCASDPRFNADTIMAEIAKMYALPALDRGLYRYVLIPAVKKALRQQKKAFAWTNTRPDWGPGRIDPFNPVKVAILDTPVDDTIGNSDMMPIWNLRPRQQIAFHWDGLNTSLVEVVRSSAVGDGAVPKSLSLGDLEKLQTWLLDLQPPKYPAERFPIDQALASTGRAIFDRQCASCHAFGGARTGQVVPLEEVGTDPHRVRMWTAQAAAAYNEYAKKYSWDFERFRSTNGYQSVPLDAVWTRAPYLHNGSVPTLRDLLAEPDRRPRLFYRGYNVFDPRNVGFVAQGPDAEREGFRYDVAQPGNSNQGHRWGTDLPARDKDALLEFLKTL